MEKLLFGTAGIPLSTPKPSTESGIEQVRKLDLDAMELEFVRSINISKEKAPLIKKVAEKNNITLTCHAPYFINLSSDERPKYHASINRIVQSAKISHLCGVYSVTFHAGFYMKQDPEKVYQKIKAGIKEILKEVPKNIWIRPETTGKETQWGSLNEIIKISKELDNVLPCVDFAHLHSRTNELNTKEEFREILEQIERHLGKTALNNMHIHMSGIAYTKKGEKHHLSLKQSDFNYENLVKVWREFKIKGVVISESPNIEKDAILLKELF